MNNGIVNAIPETIEELNAVMHMASTKKSVEIKTVEGENKLQCPWCDRAFLKKKRAFAKHVHTLHKRIPLADRRNFLNELPNKLNQKVSTKKNSAYALRGWETRRKNLQLRKLEGLGILNNNEQQQKTQDADTQQQEDKKVEEKSGWLI